MSHLRRENSSILARAQGARSILEIGTVGGYSTIWLARALANEGDPDTHFLLWNPGPRKVGV
jgi:hypothetical protein